MAVKISASITLAAAKDVASVWRYYILKPSTLVPPAIDDPTVRPPTTDGESWSLTEPAFEEENSDVLYFTDCTVFSDGEISYSSVSLSSSYDAARQAINTGETNRLAIVSMDEVIETITSNYVRWDATKQVLVNTENGEYVDTISRYLAAYMQFSQTAVTSSGGGKPLLLLGTQTGEFVTAISDTGMRFYQGRSISEIQADMNETPSTISIAYFDNNQMKINRGVVVDKLQTGKFRWETQSNNNLSFRWIG